MFLNTTNYCQIVIWLHVWAFIWIRVAEISLTHLFISMDCVSAVGSGETGSWTVLEGIWFLHSPELLDEGFDNIEKGKFVAYHYGTVLMSKTERFWFVAWSFPYFFLGYNDLIKVEFGLVCLCFIDGVCWDKYHYFYFSYKHINQCIILWFVNNLCYGDEY